MVAKTAIEVPRFQVIAFTPFDAVASRPHRWHLLAPPGGRPGARPVVRRLLWNHELPAREAFPR
jgi:hypothetical protein